jgi:2-polyprenyl-6-hydroxyphenyl methylase/3-demethylubiquinone-9 3-methyltransferase
MNNLDEKETAKFAALAASWWDEQGECKPLHDLNPCRTAFIAERATLAGARVLDVGCGGGILSEALAAAGAKVTGLDANAAVIAAAKAHAAQSNFAHLTYACAEIEHWQDESSTFDIITCMELLEHVPHPAQLLAACAERLAPGGNLFVSTINRTPKAYLQAVIGAEYVLKLLPRGTHDYLRFIRPSELARWARAAGLGLREFRGMSYNPVSGRAALRDDLGVNFLAHFAA